MVKTLAMMLLLCAVAFGQMPESKAQKQDCSNATKAVKKHGADPNISLEDFKALLDAMSLACGTPEDYAAKHSFNAPPVESDAGCENAIEAVNQNVKKYGPDPTSSRADLNLLLQAMRKACGVPEEVGVTGESHPPEKGTREDIAKEKARVDAMVGDNLVVANANPGNAAAAAPAEQAPHGDQIKDSSLNIHERISKGTSALNREIALGNRLIAHLEKAQTWDGIDADHPEAVALREKIVKEEKEFSDEIGANFALNQIDPQQINKECTEEEVDQWASLMKEATNVMRQVKTQQDRYHALGY